jgi:hypothetical protein
MQRALSEQQCLIGAQGLWQPVTRGYLDSAGLALGIIVCCVLHQGWWQEQCWCVYWGWLRTPGVRSMCN